MRQKINESLELLLNRFTQIFQQYELYLAQNQLQYVKVYERQLAYLVRVTNSLLTYGLPAGVVKQRQNRRTSSHDYAGGNLPMDMTFTQPQQPQLQQQTGEEPKFLDF